MNLRNIQERPGTQGLFTDQASFVGTVVNSAYREEIVRRFNGFAAQESKISDLEYEIRNLEIDVQRLTSDNADYRQELEDREVDDEI